MPNLGLYKGMIRIKLLKDTKHGKKGEVIWLDRNESFGLIDSGQAEVTKDMGESDYKTNTLDEEQANEHRSKVIKKTV